MSEISESHRDIWTPHEDEPDPLNESYDDAGGTSPISLSLPDQAPAMEILQSIARAVYEQIEAERKRLASIKDSQHAAAYVQFKRYEIVDTMRAVMICTEKTGRRNVTVSFLAGTAIWIGKQPGILPMGSDTVQVGIVVIAPGTAINVRTIPTKEALWAITNSVTPVIFDIVEEFDS